MNGGDESLMNMNYSNFMMSNTKIDPDASFDMGFVDGNADKSNFSNQFLGDLSILKSAL